MQTPTMPSKPPVMASAGLIRQAIQDACEKAPTLNARSVAGALQALLKARGVKATLRDCDRIASHFGALSRVTLGQGVAVEGHQMFAAVGWVPPSWLDAWDHFGQS